MVSRLIVLPDAPVLVDVLRGRMASGPAAADPVRDLVEAIHRVLAPLATAPAVQLVGLDDPAGRPVREPGMATPWGVERRIARGGLCPAEIILRHHLGAAGADTASQQVRYSSAVEALTQWRTWDPNCPVVVGLSGSTGRTLHAPSGFLPAAEHYDALLDAALSGQEGAFAQLRDFDPAAVGLGHGPVVEFLADIAAAGRYHAEVLHSSAPFGVGYVLAQWEALA